MEYPCREPDCDIFPFATETNRNAHEKYGQHTYPKGHPMHDKTWFKKAKDMLPYIVPGTGARELQSADVFTKRKVVEAIDENQLALKDEHGDRLVIMSGMAEGFDKAHALRALHNNIRLWLAIPTKDYADYYWGRNSLTGLNMMDEFNAIKDAAEKVTYVKEDVHGITDAGVYLNVEEGTASWNKSHGPHANMVRNDYMVLMGNRFLVWDPQSPGTRDCLASIRTAGKPYVLLGLR